MSWSLICISLMTYSVEHLFIYLFAIYISFLVRCLFRPFAHFFKSGFSFSCCWVLRILCIFWIAVFYQDMFLQIFSSSLSLVFVSSWPLLLVNKILFAYSTYSFIWASHVTLVVNNPPANAGSTGLVPGLGRSPAEGNSNPLQYSCLGNPMDRGAWKGTVHGVAKELDMT